jgi:YD repeat-containing protein
MAVVLGNVEPMLLQFDGAGFLYGVNDGNHFAFGSTPPSSQYLFVRDPAGRLTAINRMNPAAPNGYMSQFFSHDTADNLTQSVDANGNTTTYAYDDFFRLRKEVSPVTHTTTRTYDASGNVLSVTNANGATTTSTYDLLDRKTGSSSTGTVNGSPVTETLSYGYDNPGSAFGIGRLTSMALRDFEWVKQEEFCCSA